MATEDALNPVILEGVAELITDPGALATMLALENAKYETDYSIDLLDPAVRPAFGSGPGGCSAWRRATSPAPPPDGASRPRRGSARLAW